MKVGVDLGGSHIGIGLVDNHGKIIKKEEKFFENKNNIKEIIEVFITEKVIEMGLNNTIESIGIAVPGTVSEKQIIRAVNLGLENYNLVEKLEEILKIEVKLKNDAKCAAIAEHKYGELVEYENSIFLCIGTGVGGAVIYNGKLLEPKCVPGYEFSHTIIHKNGNICNCGKRGCFETYSSLKRFKEKIANEYNIKALDNETIIKFIKENSEDSRLKYMINNYIEDLSIGISNFINIFEPEAICFGGSFVEYENIFYEPLKKKLIGGNLLFNKRDDIIIKHAKLGNDAGIIGATLI